MVPRSVERDGRGSMCGRGDMRACCRGVGRLCMCVVGQRHQKGWSHTRRNREGGGYAEEGPDEAAQRKRRQRESGTNTEAREAGAIAQGA